MSARGLFVDRLARQFDILGIPWCVATSRDQDPREEGLSDIDLFIHPSFLSRAEEVLVGVATSCELIVFRWVRRQYGSQAFLASCSGPPEVFHVDLLPVADWWGARYLDLVDVLSQVERDRGLAYPRVADEAVYHLFHHLLWGGKVKHENRILQALDLDPNGFEARLEWAAGRKEAKRILKAIQSGEFRQGLPSMAWEVRRAVFRRALRREPSRLISQFLRFLALEMRFYARPAGIVLSVERGGEMAARRAIDLLADGRIFFRDPSIFVPKSMGRRVLSRPYLLYEILKKRRTYGVVAIEEDGWPLVQKSCLPGLIRPDGRLTQEGRLEMHIGSLEEGLVAEIDRAGAREPDAYRCIISYLAERDRRWWKR